jgi:hypothetical protein
MSLNALAGKLDDLAEKARLLQLETGTTSPTLDHLPAERKTVRDTLSLMLVSGRRAPVFALHREPTPASKDIRRAAVFGGGIRSEEEARLDALAATDPLLVDPGLLDADGKFPADAWYRMLGKQMLRTGALPQMTFPWKPATVQAFIRTELSKRLRFEVGQAARLIDDPELLTAEPVVTNVLDRRVGDYTEAIAARYGLRVENRNLVGIGIAVRERFALAELLCPPDEFGMAARGEAVLWPADRLVANAERDTADVAAWKSRMERQGDPLALPIRNHSLLVGAAGAVRGLQAKWNVPEPLRRLARRWRRRHLSFS